MQTSQGYAQSTGKAIDLEDRQLAQLAMNEAINLLKPHRNLMDKLVDILVEEEIIEKDRFLELANLPLN